jgi:1,2-diacylglycerol 3-alpha-glucosyltransferase
MKQLVEILEKIMEYREPRRSVCMFTNLFPPVVSGSSTQSFLSSRELVQRGWDVVVITAQVAADTSSYEQVDGVHVYRLPAFGLPRLPIAFNFPWLSYTFTPANLKRIEVILDRHQPAVLHLHNHMFDLAFSAALMRRRRKIPLVVTIHTMIRHANGFYNLLLYPLDRLLLKNAVIRQADAVLCPDLNIMEYVHGAFGRLDAKMLPYGISKPLAAAPELVQLLREKYQLNGKKVILSLGHVHEIRNRKDLVEAMPVILNAFPNTILLIVGVVATTTPAETARKLGIEKAVVFTGQQPHSNIAAFFELADLEAHWLTQDKPEKTSLGVATMEAMNAGKTILVVANENTYGPKVLCNGENLVLVEPDNPKKLADVILQLFRDDTKCLAIGQKARETIRTHFSWDVICARTISIYESLLCLPLENSRQAA